MKKLPYNDPTFWLSIIHFDRFITSKIKIIKYLFLLQAIEFKIFLFQFSIFSEKKDVFTPFL